MAAPALRSALPVLPRAAWVVLGADALSAVGTGLTLPFLLVYLHQVHGFSLGAAGVAVAMGAVASLAGNPLGGWLADRIGPRATLCLGLTLAGSGAAGLAAMSLPWHGLAASALTGFGVAIAWPAQDALLARLVAEDLRPAVFGLRHATLNLGLGAGSVLAAVLIDPDRAGSFAILYWFDAATFLLAVPIVLTVSTPAPPARPTSGSRDDAGYRAVLQDRAFRRLWILVAILITIGYGQLSSAFPAFATGPGGLDPRALSLAFAANTVTVVLAQLIALKLLAGWRRTRALMVLCGLWAATWAIVLVAAPAGGASAALLFALAAVVFGLGETLLAPTVPALVNDLAPDHLRGRYNGASTLAYTAGFAAGPLLAGFMLGHGWNQQWLLVLIAACAGCAVLARRLERHLPKPVNRATNTASAPELERQPA
jgi:MFS family permease